MVEREQDITFRCFFFFMSREFLDPVVKTRARCARTFSNEESTCGSVPTMRGSLPPPPTPRIVVILWNTTQDEYTRSRTPFHAIILLLVDKFRL